MKHAGFQSGFPTSTGSPSPQGLISPSLASDNETYLAELLSERQKLSPFQQVLPNCSRLLNQEIVRVTTLVGCSTFMDSEGFESPQTLRPTLEHQSLQQHPTHSGRSVAPSLRSPQTHLSSGGLPSTPYDSSTWAPLPSEIQASPSLFLTTPSTPTPSSLRWPLQPQAQLRPSPSLSQTLSLPPALPPAPSASAPVVKRSRRLEVPVEQFPTFNFVGRILGPRGNSLKRVESQTDCRVLIRGRGSIKDPVKEDKLRDKPGYEHLREPLHVIVEAELPADVVDHHVNQACEILEELLKPVDESYDIVKKAQLRELAILNGTLREESPSPSHSMRSQRSASYRGSPSPSASSSASMGDAGMKRPKTRR